MRSSCSFEYSFSINIVFQTKICDHFDPANIVFQKNTTNIVNQFFFLLNIVFETQGTNEKYNLKLYL